MWRMVGQQSHTWSLQSLLSPERESDSVECLAELLTQIDIFATSSVANAALVACVEVKVMVLEKHFGKQP